MATDPSYITLIHHDQGGALQTFESGATLDLLSGSTVDIAGTFKVGGVAVTSTAAELNLIDGASLVAKIAKVALTTGTTAGACASWTPGARKIIDHVEIDITTKVTGAGTTLDCGIAANATTLNATTLDGVDSSATARLWNSVADKGSTGVGVPQAIGATESLTVSSVGETALTGLVGNMYIHYHDI